jgi:trigger factor
VNVSATSGDETLSDQEDLVLEVGGDKPIPELSQNLLGMKVGDEKQFFVSFPEDHKAEHVAGKEVDFYVSLSKITEKHLPPLDDDFAKDMEADNLEKLTAGAWNQLVGFRRWQQREQQKTDLVNQLVEKSQFDVPESLVEDQAKILIRVNSQLMQTKEPEITEEKLSEYRSSALKMIKKDWLFGEIAKDEEVDVNDEELEAEVKKLAEERDKDPQKYMRLLEAANRIEGIKETIRENKIYDLLIEKASPKGGLIT